MYSQLGTTVDSRFGVGSSWNQSHRSTRPKFAKESGLDPAFVETIVPDEDLERELTFVEVVMMWICAWPFSASLRRFLHAFIPGWHPFHFSIPLENSVEVWKTYNGRGYDGAPRRT